MQNVTSLPSSQEGSLKLNINQWAAEDRPREKLMSLGAEALSNAELWPY